MALLDLLNNAGASLGALSSAALGAAYQRFLRLERATSEVERLFTELRFFPQNVAPAGDKPSLLGDLKKFIESNARSASVPRPASGVSYGDAKKLADLVQRFDLFEKKFEDLSRRVSEVEDAQDELKDREAEAWATIKEDLAWLRGKLGLPSQGRRSED